MRGIQHRWVNDDGENIIVKVPVEILKKLEFKTVDEEVSFGQMITEKVDELTQKDYRGLPKIYEVTQFGVEKMSNPSQLDSLYFIKLKAVHDPDHPIWIRAIKWPVSDS